MRTDYRVKRQRGTRPPEDQRCPCVAGARTSGRWRAALVPDRVAFCAVATVGRGFGAIPLRGTPNRSRSSASRRHFRRLGPNGDCSPTSTFNCEHASGKKCLSASSLGGKTVLMLTMPRTGWGLSTLYLYTRKHVCGRTLNGNQNVFQNGTKQFILTCR